MKEPIKDFGWQARADILRRDAEQKLVDPLRRHGWTAVVERVEGAGEYAVVVAERNGLRRTAALLYSSGTANAVYRQLEGEVDLTLFNGQPYELEQFTRGLSRPVHPVDEFQLHLVAWNKESEPGRIARAAFDNGEPVAAGLRIPRVRRLLAEVPAEAVWSRLSRLKSATLARKALRDRAEAEGFPLTDEIVASKGDGVAYAIRNAADYFSLRDAGNLSQRVLNVYYGVLSFVLAEMLASPVGPTRLETVEDITKQGHGLWNLDADGGFAGFCVGPLSSGLFPAWARSMGDGELPTLPKRPRRPADLQVAASEGWASMEQLFARIPEVGDLFEDVFDGLPAWVTPVHSMEMNMPSGLFGRSERAETTYVTLVDDSGRMGEADVAALPGPLREIRRMPSGTRAGHFAAAVDHPGHDHWWGALDVHRSAYERSALILPAFGRVRQYRAVCLAILYGLSIVVRYRPSLWRRVQEGDLDHMRALVEAFLAVAERVLPEQFLESVAGEKMSIHQPGSFFS